MQLHSFYDIIILDITKTFPEDFIVALPTPSNYIGPERIFAEDGKYHSQLVYISDAGIEESDGHSFYFKHKKEWEGDLPESLTDAIYSFYIVNAIRDLRGDKKTHRSMLIKEFEEWLYNSFKNRKRKE